MKIQLNSVLVSDQEKALQFYTKALGFIKKHDIPLGEARWLTVVSPEGSDDIELLLEPNGLPAAQTFQAALYQQGIPLTAFAVDDIKVEYEKLQERGVIFKSGPTNVGSATIAVFDDTVGNLIQIYEVHN